MRTEEALAAELCTGRGGTAEEECCLQHLHRLTSRSSYRLCTEKRTQGRQTDQRERIFNKRKAWTTHTNSYSA